VVWGAVFQRNILLVSSGDCLKMEVVCLLRTVSIPDVFVPVSKYTSLVLSRLKCHEIEGGWVLVWNSSFGSMICHTTFYRSKDLFSL